MGGTVAKSLSAGGDTGWRHKMFHGTFKTTSAKLVALRLLNQDKPAHTARVARRLDYIS